MVKSQCATVREPLNNSNDAVVVIDSGVFLLPPDYVRLRSNGPSTRSLQNFFLTTREPVLYFVLSSERLSSIVVSDCAIEIG